MKLADFGYPFRIHRLDSETGNHDPRQFASYFAISDVVFMAPEFLPDDAPNKKRGLPVFDENRLDQSVKWRSAASASSSEQEACEGNAFENDMKCADMWSLGAIAFLLLCGYPPFSTPCRNAMLSRIRREDYSFDAPFWSKISEDAKDFVRACMMQSSCDRISVIQALKHPWITSLAASSPSGSMFTSFSLNLVRFFHTAKIERFLAENLSLTFSASDLAVFLRVCQEMDADGFGFLSTVNINQILSDLGFTEISSSLRLLFDQAPCFRGLSYLDYAALFDNVSVRQEAIFEENVWQAFFSPDDWNHVPLDSQASKSFIWAENIESTMKNPAMQKVLELNLGGDVATHTRNAVQMVQSDMRARSASFVEFDAFVALVSKFLQKEGQGNVVKAMDAMFTDAGRQIR